MCPSVVIPGSVHRGGHVHELPIPISVPTNPHPRNEPLPTSAHMPTGCPWCSPRFIGLLSSSKCASSDAGALGLAYSHPLV
eukprot:6203644-Pleurochrysis_carterae.AAC.2